MVPVRGLEPDPSQRMGDPLAACEGVRKAWDLSLSRPQPFGPGQEGERKTGSAFWGVLPEAPASCTALPRTPYLPWVGNRLSSCIYKRRGMPVRSQPSAWPARWLLPMSSACLPTHGPVLISPLPPSGHQELAQSVQPRFTDTDMRAAILGWA